MTLRSLLSMALLVTACRPHGHPTVPEPARVPARDSLFALDGSRGDSVAARGPVNGMLALLDSDVVFLRSGVPATYGRSAARALFEAAARSGRGDDGHEARVWQPLGGGVSGDLLAGYTFGMAIRPSVRGAARPERYIAFWQRAAGEPWRITAYVEVNAPPSPRAALSAEQLMSRTHRMSRAVARATQQLRSADSLFADLSDRMGMAYAFSNMVAPYGAVFSGTRLIVGPHAVDEHYTAHARGISLTWRPVHAVAAESGDLGFSIGESITTAIGPSGAAVQRFGKYLTVWQRQSDGHWKFMIDGGNDTPSRTAP